MNKCILISGAFDCIDKKHVHLIKEAFKQAVGGEVIALVYDDYDHFKDYKFFPIQNYEQRINNLKYFVKAKNILKRTEGRLSSRVMTKVDGTFEEFKTMIIHYADDKSFPGREILRANKIPIKFIKPYAKT